MHTASKVFGRFEPTLNERLVNDHLGGDIRQFTSLPSLYLPSHGFEVSLHSIHANRDAVNQRERLGVFCQHRREVSRERHVRAYESSISTGHGETHAFVVGVTQTD